MSVKDKPLMERIDKMKRMTAGCNRHECVCVVLHSSEVKSELRQFAEQVRAMRDEAKKNAIEAEEMFDEEGINYFSGEMRALEEILAMLGAEKDVKE